MLSFKENNLTSLMIRFLVLFFLMVCPSMVYSQLSKSEYKAYKKQLKSMSVEEYGQLKKDLTMLNSGVEQLKNEINELESKEVKETNKLLTLKAELKGVREQIAILRKEILSFGEQKENQAEQVDASVSKLGRKMNSVKGVIFRVQIGAFKNKDLAKYFQKNEDFINGVNTVVDIDTYTVGSFSDYWEADAFKKLIRKMGASDVKVLVYKDGIRSSMREILEGLRPHWQNKSE